jgi:hypothetical protein
MVYLLFKPFFQEHFMQVVGKIQNPLSLYGVKGHHFIIKLSTFYGLSECQVILKIINP